MPKMKTNRGAKKRFRKGGGSKVKRGRANRRHILTKKSTKRKRALRGPAYIAPSDVKEIARLMPYG